MKKFFLKLVAIIAVTFLYYVINLAPRGKITEFKSMQKGIDQMNDKPKNTTKDSLTGVENKNRKSPASIFIQKKTRSIAKNVSIGNESEKYLSRKQDGYFFSEDIIAIHEKDFQGKPENVLTEIQGMLVVNRLETEANGLFLVKKDSENRIGLYMGKIAVIHKKDRSFEDKLKAIVGDQYKVSNIARVYLIDSKSISESVALLATLKNEFPSTQIDLDVNYSRANPK